MAEYYISPTGDDSTGDGSQALPWQSIVQAKSASLLNDTIHLANGTYAFPDNIVDTAVFENRTWIGNMTDPSLVVIDGNGELHGIRVGYTSTYTDIRGVTFTNVYQDGQGYTFLKGYDSIGLQIDFTSCIFHNLRLGHAFTRANGYIPNARLPIKFISCVFYDAFPMYAAGGGEWGGFFQAYSASIWQPQMINCTVYIDPTPSGCLNWQGIFGGITNTGYVKNCIFLNGGYVSTLYRQNTSKLSNPSYSCIYGFADATPETGDGVIFDDPLFVDAANGNFNLRPTSPCINAGTLI